MAKGNGNSTTDELILEELRKGFASINERLDKVIENTGAHWRELEKRVKALEEKPT